MIYFWIECFCLLITCVNLCIDSKQKYIKGSNFFDRYVKRDTSRDSTNSTQLIIWTDLRLQKENTMVFPDFINIRLFEAQNEYLKRSNMVLLDDKKPEIYEEATQMKAWEIKQNLRNKMHSNVLSDIEIIKSFLPNLEEAILFRSESQRSIEIITA